MFYFPVRQFLFVLDRIRHILPAFRTKDKLNRHGKSSFFGIVSSYATDYISGVTERSECKTYEADTNRVQSNNHGVQLLEAEIEDSGVSLLDAEIEDTGVPLLDVTHNDDGSLIADSAK